MKLKAYIVSEDRYLPKTFTYYTEALKAVRKYLGKDNLVYANSEQIAFPNAEIDDLCIAIIQEVE